jgi:site-specific DNA-methyltransferase (adenine-specific)
VKLRQEIVHGDGLLGLTALEPGSVSLVVSDPPWGATKAEWDEPLHWPTWWHAIDRALAADGVLVVFASFRLGLEITPLAPRRRPFLYDLIWRKNRATQHLNARRKPLRAHEQLLVFGSRDRYTPQFTYGHKPMNAAIRVSKSTLYGRESVTTSNAGVTHRYQTSVLELDTVSNDTAARIHPTQKPVALMQWIVRAYTAPGELVADPTCGSGVLIQGARLEGRSAIGWETNARFASKARAWLDGRDIPLLGGHR